MFKIARIATKLAKFNDYGLDTAEYMIDGMCQEPKFCKADCERNGENTIFDSRSVLERQQDQAMALCNRGRW